ncbi:MAG: thioredoxin family protein [Candidatus Saganbacteria bacterium]|nr:thioredoxin family protein [Candidatus Saganbacteria bacterium]
MFVLLFLLLIIAGCEDKHEVPKATQPTLPKVAQVRPKVTAKPAAKPAVKPIQKIKVTFIELGSVKCIPCKMMQPIMDEITEEYKDQVKVVFYDVWTDEGRPYAEKYRVRGIPTQVFLDEKGEEFYRHVGFFPKDELVKVLELKKVK